MNAVQTDVGSAVRKAWVNSLRYGINISRGRGAMSHSSLVHAQEEQKAKSLGSAGTIRA